MRLFMESVVFVKMKEYHLRSARHVRFPLRDAELPLSQEDLRSEYELAKKFDEKLRAIDEEYSPLAKCLEAGICASDWSGLEESSQGDCFEVISKSLKRRKI